MHSHTHKYMYTCIFSICGCTCAHPSADLILYWDSHAKKKKIKTKSNDRLEYLKAWDVIVRVYLH